MDQGEQPVEDKGLSVWVVVALAAATVIVLGVLTFVAYEALQAENEAAIASTTTIQTPRETTPTATIPDTPTTTTTLPKDSLLASVDDISLVGVATFVEDGFALRVTPSINSSVAGAAWFIRKQPVSQGFETTFAFRIHDIPQNPGDGLAFVIQNSSVTALGEASFGIGYTDIANSVAVEFDTVRQDYSGDPAPFHVGVHTRGTERNSSHESASIGRFIPTFRLADGLVHVVKVEYAPGTLTVYLDDLANPALTVQLDLDATLRLDSGRAWVGFTASTEPGFRETHDILSWSFTPVS